MSHAVLTNVRDVSGRQLKTLDPVVRQALMRMDEVLRANGIQFELICETCRALSPDNPNAWTVHAEHGNGDGSLKELVCRCTRRQFQAAF
jgi:hypothetical protein